MSDLLVHLPQLAAAYLIYLIAVVSPGPANIAIIGTAINQGRKPAIVIALGIFAGSFTWAMAAALGLSAILTRYGEVLQVLKVLGGLYLLYLGFKACRGALRRTYVADLAKRSKDTPLSKTFLTGYGIHLTNPKSIFGWLATISVGLPPGASASSVALVVAGCLLTGLAVFLGHALLFSTARAGKLYQSARRPLDALMALVFGTAGVKMISSAL